MILDSQFGVCEMFKLPILDICLTERNLKPKLKWFFMAKIWPKFILILQLNRVPGVAEGGAVVEGLRVAHH